MRTMQSQNPIIHVINLYFTNNNISFLQQFLNRSSTSNHPNDIVAYLIPIILTFVQIRYTSEDLFQTHPKTIAVFISSFSAYCLAFWFVSRSHNDGHRDARKYKRCCITLRVFGSVSITSLASLLFPKSWQPSLFFLWVGEFLLLLALLRKFRWQHRMSPILPVTILHLPIPTRMTIVNSESRYFIPMNDRSINLRGS